MTIELYINTSDGNRVDKELELITTLVGSLKDSSSILDPVITIELSSIGNINYIFIQEFGRFYYITNITSVRNGIWTISCHVDVLMSWRYEIRRTGCVISRQENASTLGNLYLDDDRFLVTSKRKFSLMTFPYRMTTGSDSFVLTVAGGE